jgi:hypothetical protein
MPLWLIILLSTILAYIIVSIILINYPNFYYHKKDLNLIYHFGPNQFLIFGHRGGMLETMENT